jgi:hypothetical protein
MLYQAAALRILTNSGDTYFQARMLSIFLSGLYYAPAVTVKFLVKNNLFETMIDRFVKLGAYFSHDYDRKILVLGLMSIFRLKISEQQLDEVAIKCLDFSVLNLHIQRVEQGKAIGYYKGKVLKSEEDATDYDLYETIHRELHLLAELPDNDMDDDFEMDDDSDYGENKEQMEIYKALMTKKGKAALSLKNFKSPVRAENEFQYFQQLIRELKVNFFNQNTFGIDNLKKLVDRLSSQSQNAIQGIMLSQKIELKTKGEQPLEVARKVLKVKRPNKPQAN